MMDYALDHVVHFVDKPEIASKYFHAIGLLAVSGGKHEMWGTYNGLSYFGLSYIEWISVFDDELLEKSAKQPYSLHDTYKRMGYHKGLTRVALRSNNLEQIAEKFRTQGYEVYGPENFSRVKPDGDRVSWQLLYVGKKGQDLDFPFFIQWDESDEERLRTLTAQGAVNKGIIEKVQFAVKDAISVATEWAALLGSSVGDVNKSADGVTVSVNISNVEFVFYSKLTNVVGVQKPMSVTIRGAGVKGSYEVEGALYELR